MKPRPNNTYRLMIVLFAAMLITGILKYLDQNGWNVSMPQILLLLLPVVIVIGIVALITWRADKRSDRKQTFFREHGRCIKGTVTSVSSVRLKRLVLWEIGAEFEYNNNRYYAASKRLYSKPLREVGDTINVYFMPDNPNKNMILDADAML